MLLVIIKNLQLFVCKIGGFVGEIVVGYLIGDIGEVLCASWFVLALDGWSIFCIPELYGQCTAFPTCA